MDHGDTCDSGTRLWSAWGRCWREWGTPGSTAAGAKSWAWGTRHRPARAPRLVRPCTLHTSQNQGACRCSHCCSPCAAEPPSPFSLKPQSRKKKKKNRLRADFLVGFGFGFRSSRLKILWLSKVRLGLEWEHLCCLLAKVKAKMLKGYICIIQTQMRSVSL